MAHTEQRISVQKNKLGTKFKKKASMTELEWRIGKKAGERARFGNSGGISIKQYEKWADKNKRLGNTF